MTPCSFRSATSVWVCLLLAASSCFGPRQPQNATGALEQAGLTAPQTSADANASASTSSLSSGPNDIYTLVGRFDREDPNHPICSHLSCKVGARFVASSVAVSITDAASDFFNVSIDGGAPIVIGTAARLTPQILSIAQNLSAGEHTVWMTKRTEASEQDTVNPNLITGAFTFNGFVLGPGGQFLSRPNVHAHLVEAMGDSAFTGYGVDVTVTGANDACTYTTATQNGDQSVVALMGKLLNVETINLSASGRAIFNSYYDPNDASGLLPLLYDETVQPHALPAYNFVGQMPDAIVLEGGANDLFGEFGNGTFPDRTGFMAAYTNWVADVRQHNPHALIVLALSPDASGNDRTSLLQASQEVIQKRALANDTNVVVFDTFANDPNGWQSYADAAGALNLKYGCEGHPSQAGSAFLAGRLATFLAQHLGWPAP